MSMKVLAFLLLATAAKAEDAPVAAYKTADGTVVVTGLKPTQRFQIRMIDAKGKPGTRQDKSANRCGEVVVEKASTYQAMNVGTHSIDPAALPVREHVRCKPAAPAASMKPKGVEAAKTPDRP